MIYSVGMLFRNPYKRILFTKKSLPHNILIYKFRYENIYFVSSLCNLKSVAQLKIPLSITLNSSHCQNFSTMVEIETTPNPNAKMFFPLGQTLLPIDAPDSVSFDLNSIHDCTKPKSPLAESILQVNGVYSILLCKEYLTVVKQRHTNWDELESEVIKKVNEFSSAGLLPSFEDVTKTSQKLKTIRKVSSEIEEEADSELEEIIDAIKTLIYTRARPMVMEDGGDIEFIRFDEDEGVVWIYMKGACEGCPSSTLTLQQGLATMLRYFIPEVKHVKQCDENGDPLLDEDDE